MSKWISTQDDELVLTVEMTAVESQFNNYSSYNPAFNVSRLPTEEQAEARSSIEGTARVLDTRSVRGTESAPSAVRGTESAPTSSSSSPRKPMKEVLSFGSVRFNALSSPHSFRQSEMRSPGGRMTLSNHPSKPV